MLAAIAVFLLGAAMTASGILVATMYDIGIVVLIIGALGVGIRLLDWLRLLQE